MNQEEEINTLVTEVAVMNETLKGLEAHLDAQDAHLRCQDADILTLKKSEWVSQGMKDVLSKFIPILVVAAAGILSGWFLKVFV